MSNNPLPTGDEQRVTILSWLDIAPDTVDEDKMRRMSFASSPFIDVNILDQNYFVTDQKFQEFKRILKCDSTNSQETIAKPEKTLITLSPTEIEMIHKCKTSNAFKKQLIDFLKFFFTETDSTESKSDLVTILQKTLTTPSVVKLN
jgi:hypothetical protein